jgi:hypothetical protein
MGVECVEHAEGDGEEMFESVCKLGLEGIVSKRATSVYKSGPSRPPRHSASAYPTHSSGARTR